jgi:hypothetical protein
MKLWPVGKVLPIRFYDTRHTAASLLMMFGANPAAIRHILRQHGHPSDVNVYGHLAPGYLRTEIDQSLVSPQVRPIYFTGNSSARRRPICGH